MSADLDINLSFGFISLQFGEIFLASLVIFFEIKGRKPLNEKKSPEIARKEPELLERKTQVINTPCRSACCF